MAQISPLGESVDEVATSRIVVAANFTVEPLEDSLAFTLITEADVLDAYPVGEIHDPQAEAIGAIPYTSEFFAAMGTYLARRIYSLKRAPYKVIALDCDNTLWKGVVGEDGPTGIQLTDRHIALQKFVVRQSELGMLVCLCSKNNEADVWEAFAAHPDMPLQREHIVAHRINWEPESANLRALSDQLSLDLSSFCFIDDSPMECAEVRDACPQVLALSFPPTQDPAFLKEVWAFDRAVVTQEDRQLVSHSRCTSLAAAGGSAGRVAHWRRGTGRWVSAARATDA
jgi:HAD superfamily phosphatase (TIGR01681 family)